MIRLRIFILLLGLTGCGHNNQASNIPDETNNSEVLEKRIQDSTLCTRTKVLSEKIDFNKVKNVKLSNINGPHYLANENWEKLKPRLENAECVNGLICKPKSLSIMFELENGKIIDGYFCGRFLNFDRKDITGSFEIKEKINLNNY